jgi:hypothetical protein
MADVVLTPCKGERVIHDGHVYDPGEKFKLGEDAAATLIDAEIAEKASGKATDKGPGAESEAPEGEVPPAKDVIAAVPDMDDAALATALEAEEAQDPQRKSVLKKIKAEQQARADAAEED